MVQLVLWVKQDQKEHLDNKVTEVRTAPLVPLEHQGVKGLQDYQDLPVSLVQLVRRVLRVQMDNEEKMDRPDQRVRVDLRVPAVHQE